MCWQCLYGDNCVCAKKKAQTNNKTKQQNVNCFRGKTTGKKSNKHFAKQGVILF